MAFMNAMRQAPNIQHDYVHDILDRLRSLGLKGTNEELLTEHTILVAAMLNGCNTHCRTSCEYD